MKNRQNYITKGACLITIAAGCSVLAGWLFDIPACKSILPGTDSMKPDTALCFILAGLSLYLLDTPSFSRSRYVSVGVCSWALLMTALFSLCRQVMDWDFYPGKMSLISSVNFSLFAIAFLLLRAKKFQWLMLGSLIATLPGSLVVIFNYLYGINFLNTIPTIGDATFPAGLLFIILGTGAFFIQAPGYTRSSLVKRIAVFFVFIFLVRSIVFFALSRNNAKTADMYQWVEQTHNRILGMAERANSQFSELEGMANRFFITGDEKELPFLANVGDTLKSLLSQLKFLTREDIAQQQRIDTLEAALTGHIGAIEELVNVRRNEGTAAVQHKLLDGRGQLLPKKEHTLIKALEDDESQALERHKARNAKNIQNSARLLNLFQGIALLLMVVALAIIRNNSRQRNKTEEDLQKSLKETSDYKHALDESSIVAITNPQGVIKYVNDNFCKISKYSREELIGQDHRMIRSGFHDEAFISKLWATIAGGKIWRGDIKSKAKDGTYYWVDTTIIPFLDKKGNPYQYVAIRSDITQRKELEDAIGQFNQQLQKNVEEKTREVIEKEQQYRFLLENMREGIQVIGYDWKYLFVNNSLEQHAKYTREEMLGHTIREKYPGPENNQLFGLLERCMVDRCHQNLENEFTFPDGSKRWFELSIQPVPEGLFILSMDITERKKAEQRLRESERFLIESQVVSKIGSYVLDFTTGVWKGSGELENIFGTGPRDEHSVEGWLSVIHPDQQKMMQEYFTQEVIEKRSRFDKEYKIINKKTGKEAWVHGIGHLETDADGKLVTMLGTIQDITERKKIAEILRSGDERFELVNKATFDTFWDWNYLTNTGQWGEGIVKTFGYTKDKAKYDENWLQEFVHPDDRERIFNNIHDYVKKGLENWHDEYRFRCADGSYKEVFARGTILFDEHRSAYRMIGAMTDVTERKRLEKELTEQKLREQRLITEITIEAQEKERSELGRELHDNINQILSVVKIYLKMAMSGEPAREDLITKSHGYVEEVMEEIRKLSHSLVPPSLGDLDLEEALHELASDTNLLNVTKVKLVFDERYNGKNMDRNKELMLFRIVQEQLNNITKYARAKDTIITLKAENDKIFLSIADNGDGFDTTKKVNGIGLKNIGSRVAFYSGTMNIISAPGKGCVLEVNIPVVGKS